MFMPKAEFNISHRPCAFQAVGNWMTYYCGQVKKANIMTSSFISNFPRCRMCQVFTQQVTVYLPFSGHFANQISPLEAHKRW